MNLTDIVLDKLFPKTLYCPLCKGIHLRSDNYFCKNCYKKIIWSRNDNTCIKCGRILKNKYHDLKPWNNFMCLDCIEKEYHFDKVFSVLLYSKQTKNIPLGLKKNEEFNYLNLMSELMIFRLKTTMFYKNLDYISYVPMANNKLKKLGFNHSLLLALRIGENLGKKILNNSILKSNSFQETKFLYEEQRYKFLKDSFIINKDFDFRIIKNKSILIVDDVFTTGYTLSILSKIYKDKGAKSVYGLTFTTRHIK